MALQKDVLKIAIEAAFNNARTKTEDPDLAISLLAQSIADAVDTYVKGATIAATPGNITSATISNSAGLCASSFNLYSSIS